MGFYISYSSSYFCCLCMSLFPWIFWWLPFSISSMIASIYAFFLVCLSGCNFRGLGELFTLFFYWDIMLCNTFCLVWCGFCWYLRLCFLRRHEILVCRRLWSEVKSTPERVLQIRLKWQSLMVIKSIWFRTVWLSA